MAHGQRRGRPVSGQSRAQRRHRDLRGRDRARECSTTFHFLRQQTVKAEDRANHCLADLVAPKESGVKDYLGCFAVTAGIGIEPRIEAFEAKHDDYSAIMLKALADRLAEAFAELMHLRVRREFWGYAAGREPCASMS